MHTAHRWASHSNNRQRSRLRSRQLAAFDFDPVGAIGGTIRCVDTLADDAFEEQVLGSDQDYGPVVKMLGEAKSMIARTSEDLFKDAFACDERLLAQVFAVGEEQIEGPHAHRIENRLAKV